MLHSGFRMKIVLKMQWCLSCWQIVLIIRTFQLLTPALHQRDWENTKSCEETSPGQMTPTDHRDVPQHTVSCSASNLWGKLVGGGLLRNWLGIHQSERWAATVCILCFDCYYYYFPCCCYNYCPYYCYYSFSLLLNCLNLSPQFFILVFF